MGIRVGDEVVEIEGRIEVTTEKAYLIALTSIGPDEVWMPKSQIIWKSDPDPDGIIVFGVKAWIAEKNGLV